MPPDYNINEDEIYMYVFKVSTYLNYQSKHNMMYSGTSYEEGEEPVVNNRLPLISEYNFFTKNHLGLWNFGSHLYGYYLSIRPDRSPDFNKGYFRIFYDEISHLINGKPTHPSYTNFPVKQNVKQYNSILKALALRFKR